MSLKQTRRIQAGRAFLCAGFLILIILRLTAAQVERADRTIHLQLVCSSNQCTATLNGKVEIKTQLPPALEGSRLGFYTYHPYYLPPARQYFRLLSLSEGVYPARHIADWTLVNAPTSGPILEKADGYGIFPGEGLAHVGRQGDRSVALLKDHRRTDFKLTVHLVDVDDAGIFFRGSDEHNGMVFVVRSCLNDAFFFPLESGEPGAITAMAPIHEMTVGREGLRLAGLVSDILLKCGVLLVLLYAACGRLRRIRLSKISPPSIQAVPSLLLLATLALLVLVFTARFSLHNMPHIEDENVYFFQAKVFADGRLWAPAPVYPEFFTHEHMIMQSDRWFSKYPPLWSALLAIGVKIGTPWIINPLLGALLVAVTFALSASMKDRATGLIAGLLLITSPFFIFMGASLMSHTASALLITLFFLLVVRGMKTPCVLDFSGAGICLGLAILTRPYTALLAALTAGLYLASHVLGLRKKSEFLRCMLVLCLCTLVFAGAFIWWNHIHADPEAQVAGLYSSYDQHDTLGFGASKGTGWLKTWGSWGHTPAKALRSVYWYLAYTAHYLFGWPLRLSFSLALFGLFAGKTNRERFLLAGLFLALVLGHMLYWSTNHISYGARYWFEALPGITILSAIGIRALARPADTPSGIMTGADALLVAVVGGLIIWNLILYLPARFVAGYNYGNSTPELRQQVAELDVPRALIFVQTEGLLYNDGFYMNEPDLASARVFARDLGPENARLTARYPDYEVYYWNKVALQKRNSAREHRDL